MNKQKISIVVITWNSINYLKQTVIKILELDYSNLEFIYVNNGSNDGTREYLESFKEIKLINNDKNLGTSVARNQGAKRASGEYILFMDDDIDILDGEFISNIIPFYKKLDNPAFLMPLLVDIEDKEKMVTRMYGATYDMFGINKLGWKQIDLDKIIDYKKDIPIQISQTGAMFVKKDVWDDLGGFDESQMFNLDDDDISSRAWVLGYRNYLYNNHYLLHIGLQKRMNIDRYVWNDRLYYSGKTIAMWKNFSFSTLLYMFPLSSGKIIAESIYHSFRYRSIRIFFATVSSIMSFFFSLPRTLIERKKIQKRRKIKDREIFKVKSIVKLLES